MRELKFRAWDKKQKRIRQIIRIEFPFGKIEGLSKISMDDNYLKWEYARDLIIMQYTGLKDKNGKEIYESDYIKWEIQRGRFIVSEVIFTRGEFCVRSGGLVWGCGNSCSKDGQLGDVKIVGNIYDNPELVEGVMTDD